MSAIELEPETRARVALAVAGSIYRPRKPDTPTPRMKADALRALDAMLSVLAHEGYTLVRSYPEEQR